MNTNNKLNYQISQSQKHAHELKFLILDIEYYVVFSIALIKIDEKETNFYLNYSIFVLLEYYLSLK